MEKDLQGIKFGGRILEVNIARFERKPASNPDRRNGTNQNQNRLPLVPRFNARDNRSFSAFVTGENKYSRAPPPPLIESWSYQYLG